MTNSLARRLRSHWAKNVKDKRIAGQLVKVKPFIYLSCCLSFDPSALVEPVEEPFAILSVLRSDGEQTFRVYDGSVWINCLLSSDSCYLDFSCSNKFRFRDCCYWFIRILDYLLRYDETRAEFVLVVNLLSVLQEFHLRDAEFFAMPNIMSALSDRHLSTNFPTAPPVIDSHTASDSLLPTASAPDLPGVFAVSSVSTQSVNSIPRLHSGPSPATSPGCLNTDDKAFNTIPTVDLDGDTSFRPKSHSSLAANVNSVGHPPPPFSYPSSTGGKVVAVVAPMSESIFESCSFHECSTQQVPNNAANSSSTLLYTSDSPFIVEGTPPQSPLSSSPATTISSESAHHQLLGSTVPQQPCSSDTLNIHSTENNSTTTTPMLSTPNTPQQSPRKPSTPTHICNPVQSIEQPNLASSFTRLLSSHTSKLLSRLTNALSCVIPTPNNGGIKCDSSCGEKSRDSDCRMELGTRSSTTHGWHLSYVSLGRLVHSLLGRIRHNLISGRRSRLRQANCRRPTVLRQRALNRTSSPSSAISVGSIYKPEMSLAWTTLPSDIDLEMSVPKSFTEHCSSLSILSLPAHIFRTRNPPGAQRATLVCSTNVEDLLRTTVRDVSTVAQVIISTSSEATLRQLLSQ